MSLRSYLWSLVPVQNIIIGVQFTSMTILSLITFLESVNMLQDQVNSGIFQV